MKYLVVLQFSFADENQFEDLVRLEEALDKVIKFHSFVDGHDIGENEANIFIHSDEPREAFRLAKRVIDDWGKPLELRAAFRPSTGSEYEFLWPSTLKHFAVQ